MTTKIKLRSGFPKGYLPQGITYKNYTMLVAIANYSDNGSCCGTAHTLIEEVASIERKNQLVDGVRRLYDCRLQRHVCRGLEKSRPL
jgi:hypothetical protein